MSNDCDDEVGFCLMPDADVRLQCLHRVLDCGDWNLALPRETIKVLEATEELAAYVLTGKKPDANVRKFSDYAN